MSGQVAQDEHGELASPGDPGAQARQVFENLPGLRRCLAEAGAGFGDVVKLGFFVIDVADLPAVRAARDAAIDTSRPPASTAVQVAALFDLATWSRPRPGPWSRTSTSLVTLRIVRSLRTSETA